MAAGSIKTIVCVNVNPVFDAPADLGFAEAFAKVQDRISLSVGKTETAVASTWSLNGAHWLESWSDTAANDGTVAPTQPMIAPLYGPAKNDIELLAMLAGDEEPDGFDIVQQAWAKVMGTSTRDGDFQRIWKRALRDGFMPNSAGETSTPKVRATEVAKALGTMTFAEAPALGALDVVFVTGSIGDGRDANNAWLQEMPHPITKVVWDNTVVIIPATARAL